MSQRSSSGQRRITRTFTIEALRPTMCSSEVSTFPSQMPFVQRESVLNSPAASLGSRPQTLSANWTISPFQLLRRTDKYEVFPVGCTWKRVMSHAAWRMAHAMSALRGSIGAP